MNRLQRSSKNVFMQILWTGVDGSIPCLFLITDTKRYMFNCSEGLQRLCAEKRIRIKKLNNFFFTQCRWSHLGGFPGFAMTLRDVKNLAIGNAHIENAGKKQNKQKKEGQKQEALLNVHGPEGIVNVLDVASRFMKFDKSEVKLSVKECNQNSKSKIYDDAEMTIHSMPVYGNVDLTASNVSLTSHRLLKSLAPSLAKSPTSVCYACHLKALPGKFDVEKAMALGIPRGPLYGRLQRGETITLNDGTQIVPSQVVDPDIPGTIALVIDCPSVSYIPSLVENAILRKYTSTEQQAHVVLHLAKNDVCDHEKYAHWIDSFPEDTRHFFIKDIPKIKSTFKGQNGLQSLLNRIDSNFFPLIDQDIVETCKNELKENSLLNFAKINLRESKSKGLEAIDLAMALKNDDVLDGDKTYQEKIKQLQMNEPQINEVNHFGKRPLDVDQCPVRKRPHLEDFSQSYPRIVCLGTGAALPSKFRNVSATLVFLSDDVAFLFDCGEDTYGQLQRHYGKGTDDILKKIKMILISHLHADHHLGLFAVLRNISRVVNDYHVVVVGPYFYRDWFMKYGETSELIQCQFAACTDLVDGSTLCKGIHVQSVKVEHPARAFGFVVKNKQHSIVYSGDTKPCDRLVRAGHRCTLLIHEATLEDGLEDEAIAKCHSTTSQALEIAQRMKAQHLLMTHFSQRYPVIPRFQKNMPISDKTVIAFDHMEITLDAILSFPKLIPKLCKIMEEEVRVEEERDKEDSLEAA